MVKGVGASHAKTILLGEHSVVYGRPAIAFPIRSLSLRATATFTDDENYLATPFHSGSVADQPRGNDPLEKKLAETAFRNATQQLQLTARKMNVSVDGYIPPARGLGSSAAVAGAIIKAIADLHKKKLSPAEQFELIQSVERVAHGTPSGLDVYATSTEVPIWFQNGSAKPLQVLRDPPLLIADTGLSGHTAEAVAIVRSKLEKKPGQVQKLFDDIASLTEEAGSALTRAEFETLGELMNKNHEILQYLGVSDHRLETLITAARNAGAAGAKLTGGGLGGCIVVLARHEGDLKNLSEQLVLAGAKNVWLANGADAEAA